MWKPWGISPGMEPIPEDAETRVPLFLPGMSHLSAMAGQGRVPAAGFGLPSGPCAVPVTAGALGLGPGSCLPLLLSGLLPVTCCFPFTFSLPTLRVPAPFWEVYRWIQDPLPGLSTRCLFSAHQAAAFPLEGQ